MSVILVTLQHNSVLSQPTKERDYRLINPKADGGALQRSPLKLLTLTQLTLLYNESGKFQI
jgi:hypothetical protein